MRQKTSFPRVKPVIAYTALVGKVILEHRKRRNLDQNDLAGALGLTQSTYSRIEQGQTTITIAQLRAIAECLGVSPSGLLQEADALVGQLRAQGVNVTNEKGIHPAAILVGLGILAAILGSR